MPEETRYFTLSGKVPNGGVPYGRMVASVTVVPSGPYYPSRHPFPPGPFSGGHAPPPPYHSPQNNATPPPGPPPPGPLYKPAGHYLDGPSYITPSEYTTIRFVSDGSRPCDAPGGYLPHFHATKHLVPRTFVSSLMTVGELIRRLDAPAGNQYGITEMVELPDGRFAAAETVMQGSEEAKKTLREMGWTQRRSEAANIWLAVKR